MDTDFPCPPPPCRKRAKTRGLKPDRNLAKMTEITEQQMSSLCEEHKENVLLFCEDDQKPICVQCNRSQDHSSHTVIPIQETVQEYKAKLLSYLEPLRSELKRTQAFESSEEENTKKLKKQIEIHKQEIICEFEMLRHLLEKEKEDQLARLENVEQKILQEPKENIRKLTEQSYALEKLIAEIEKKCQQPAIDLVKEINSSLDRYQVEFPQPEPFLPDLDEKTFDTFHPFVLRSQVVNLIKVSVTLDPETAKSELILSADRKSVKSNPKCTRFDDNCCVLGYEGFTSGRHCWEVLVEAEKYCCSVGVSREAVSRKGWIKPSVENGIWALKLSTCFFSGMGCCALTSPETLLTPCTWPSKLGVYLDYDRGRLSFYNAATMEHLYTFTASFIDKVFPYFHVGSRSNIIL